LGGILFFCHPAGWFFFAWLAASSLAVPLPFLFLPLPRPGFLHMTMAGHALPAAVLF